jgi:hypothetical protein
VVTSQSLQVNVEQHRAGHTLQETRRDSDDRYRRSGNYDTSMLAHRGKIVSILVALAFFSLAPTVASASTAGPAPGMIGADVSYPQCATGEPIGSDFAVVGVTNGTLFTTNTCIARELSWASSLAVSPAFYITTADPGPAYSLHWPASDTTSPKACDGTNTTACSYDYGWSAALASYQSALGAETADGATNPQGATSAATWWLDVENSSSWQTQESQYGATASFETNDQAALEGMVAALQSEGVTSLGIYSNAPQWQGIMGATGATFAALPIWLAGFSSSASAQTGCASVSFSGGPVALTQYVAGNVDDDVACSEVDAATHVAATVTGTSARVTWVAPVSGGATSYTVSASPGTATCQAATTSCVVSKLKPGSSYTFTVSAVIGGTTLVSTPSKAVTLVGVPGSVSLKVTSPMRGVLQLVVGRAASPSGVAVTYQYSLNGRPWVALPVPSTRRADLRRLSPDRFYSVRVRAIDTAGAGRASTARRVLVRA